MSTLELITLHLPPALEDVCVELLLEHPSTHSFSSTPARGHGEAVDALSLTEQVSGWRRETRIEVVVEASARAGLLAVLQARLATPAVRYRVTPVAEAGDFGPPD